MILRHIKQEILELLGFFPVVGIIGPRQSGKTTLVKQIAAELQKPTIYLDLESFGDAGKLTNPELFFKNNMDKCIILDEIQQMPELFPLLRSVIDIQREPSRFIILGSASPVIMRNTSESLAGRIAYKELTPFNFIELSISSEMKIHWFRGGFPNSYLSPSDKIATAWIDSFITTYIEKDFPFFGLNVSSGILRKFWTMLGGVHGGILNANALASALDISAPTVRKYIYYLENAFMVNCLPPFYININKRLVKAPKLYIRDSGILHFLRHVNTFKELEINVLIGKSWEGYVVEQIKELLPKRVQMYYYRTHSGTECDIVLAKGDMVVAAIEVKYSSAPKTTKGLTLSIQDLNPQKCFIITPSSDDYLLKESIRVCNLSDFLNIHLKQVVK